MIHQFLIIMIAIAIYIIGDNLYVYANLYLRQERDNNNDIDRSLSSTIFSQNNNNNNDNNNEIVDIDNELMWSPDLFQGDMVMSKSQISQIFGQTAANEIEAAGLLARSEEIIKSTTKGSDDDDKVVVNNDNDNNNNNDNHNRNNNNDDDASSGSDDDDDAKRRLGMITNYDYLWKTRDSDNIVIVPYELQSSLSSPEQSIIQTAMSHITSKTGVVKFIVRTNESDWIYFQNKDVACWSYVGRIGGKQTINVYSACGFGATVHEIYHALGFQHEQSRSDRDDYVTINWGNIQSGKEYNFYKETTNSLGSPYDYQSIMHYGATAFAISAPKCTATSIKTDTVTRIKYQSSTVDSNTAYCFNVVNGNIAINEGQTVNFRPCGENNYANQYWIAESFGIGYNVIRFALDPSYCLTVNYINSIKDTASLILNKCIEGTYDNQHFMFEQSSWTDVTFLWGNDTAYAITRNKTVGIASTYSIYLKSYGYDSYIDQDFTVEFISKTTGRSATVNTYCKYQAQTTIDSKGNSIGQRSGLSTEDITQLQLLYQCPSGPRNINVFCTTDCKCKENQGKCTKDNQCEPGLYCSYDGISMNRCYPIPSPTAPTTLEPTLSPSKVPTNTPTPKPTNVPTIDPTARPTKTPTLKPTNVPTKDPTLKPTSTPTVKPTNVPTKDPTFTPTKTPTLKPTNVPTKDPTLTPTKTPTLKPTSVPTNDPTLKPTIAPTTKSPTKDPTTSSPTTKSPTRDPTLKPTTSKPTKNPLVVPTNNPVIVPTINPTTNDPTTNPTKIPSHNPTKTPTTKSPSVSPSKKPTTSLPTTKPSSSPTTASPTQKPITLSAPTNNPSTTSPTKKPSRNPTTHAPTASPISNPTVSPILNPTVSPISNPTTSPQTSQCNYSKKKTCKKDPKCVWGKVGKKSKCMEFSCSVYVDEITCKLDTRCKWKRTKLTCINK